MPCKGVINSAPPLVGDCHTLKNQFIPPNKKKPFLFPFGENAKGKRGRLIFLHFISQGDALCLLIIRASLFYLL